MITNVEAVRAVKDWECITEASAITGYSRKHLWLLADTGQIVAKKSGSIWLIYVPSVFQYLYVRGA